MSQIANIAAYKFTPLADREGLKTALHARATQLELKGTVLLAPEGINLFLAGDAESVHSWLDALRTDARFSDIDVKWSWSDHVPFRRLRIRLKNEIVTLRLPDVAPGEAPYLPAAELERWLDEGRDIVLLDTRNAWEVAAGSFEAAIDPGLRSFGEFPRAIEELMPLRDKTIVTFCTGGIRCEKAAPLMRARGFEHVYQLEGGILKYFEIVGGRHWRGNCVVFDDRGALDPELRPASAEA